MKRRAAFARKVHGLGAEEAARRGRDAKDEGNEAGVEEFGTAGRVTTRGM